MHKKIKWQTILFMGFIFILSMNTLHMAYANGHEADPSIGDTYMCVYSGNGTIGYKNGRRADASFITPQGMAVGLNGELLVADADANMIRKITKESVATIAGQVIATSLSGIPIGGYKDRVPAKEALLNGPKYVAVSAIGDIYFTEYNNNMIRVIKKEDGKSYVFSGSTKAGYENGDLKSSKYNSPSGMAVDSKGNVYVADTLNNCIRKIDGKGTSALFAGLPNQRGRYKDGNALEAGFCEPSALAFDKNGALYVADTGNSIIRKIENGQVSTVAGVTTPIDINTGNMNGDYKDGDVTAAAFKYPRGLFVAEDNAVYVADTGNNRVRKIENNKVTTVAGNGEPSNGIGGGATTSALNKPFNVVCISGGLFITDSLNHCIKVVYPKY